MANIATHIGRTRSAVGRIIDAYGDVLGCVKEYNALGGQEAVHPYFVTKDPETGEEKPRTDIDITEQQYIDAIASLGTIGALLETGHNTNLFRVRG